ncbi:MAG: hypothetical protein GWO20_15020, partial [Candidatus Korarchaeota archaeon]|nr:hypothetical protein [Candidatus Korarchaeota archaeon]
MEDAFVWDDISKQEFEDIHPDADTEGFEKTSMDAGWKDDNNIRVAEYFKKEYENKTLVKYTIRSEIIGDLERVSYKEDVPEGVEIVAERKVRVCKIKWYKLSGKEILEEGEFLGDYIPIVPVYGF